MTNQNIYQQFIEYLKKEEKQLNLKTNNLEKHHIKPLHYGGLPDGEVVICSAKNHTLAHYYRYLTFKQVGDSVAFKMRWNQTIGIRERAKLAVEKNKKLKNLFWDTKWQSIQGKKGGIKGGSANSFNQYKARQKVGFSYGKKTGIKNASLNLKKFLSKQTTWLYKPKNKPTIKIVIAPQKSFSYLIDILIKISKIKINKSSFYKIVHGQRKQMYGWSLVFIKL
jgi:hypothetical protein